MTGLSDSLTIGILLILIFGAVSFYLYSRLSQNEKRVSLLENLLLTLKMNTEASLGGPEFVEAISNATPLSDGDVEAYSENQGTATTAADADAVVDVDTTVDADANAEEEAAKLLRSLSTGVEKKERTMDANYESMSVKELQALARQRGLTGVPKHKRDLIDALKKGPGGFGSNPPLAPTPLAAGDLEKVDVHEGFTVEL